VNDLGSGFLASALLHLPIGITYIKAVQADRPPTKAEWAAAIAYTVIFAAVGVAGSNVVMHDSNSPARVHRRANGPPPRTLRASPEKPEPADGSCSAPSS
jgi:hypothetical protein